MRRSGAPYDDDDEDDEDEDEEDEEDEDDADAVADADADAVEGAVARIAAEDAVGVGPAARAAAYEAAMRLLATGSSSRRLLKSMSSSLISSESGVERFRLRGSNLSDLS